MSGNWYVVYGSIPVEIRLKADDEYDAYDKANESKPKIVEEVFSTLSLKKHTRKLIRVSDIEWEDHDVLPDVSKKDKE